MTDREFIAIIAPIVQKYCKQYGYWVASPIIAQACIESAYGRSKLSAVYGNLFGLKCGSGWTGPSVNMKTNEEYTTGLTSIRDNFRVYQDKNGKADWDAGVKGYFDFIQYPRYANLKTATECRQYLEYIKADGYATASNYVTTCMKVVYQYSLTTYDGNTITEPPINKVTPFAGTVTASALNVRKGPGTGYGIVQVEGHDFQLPKGICCAFEAECNSWFKLSGVDGWVSSQYLLR